MSPFNTLQTTIQFNNCTTPVSVLKYWGAIGSVSSEDCVDLVKKSKNGEFSKLPLNVRCITFPYSIHFICVHHLGTINVVNKLIFLMDEKLK